MIGNVSDWEWSFAFTAVVFTALIWFAIYGSVAVISLRTRAGVGPVFVLMISFLLWIAMTIGTLVFHVSIWFSAAVSVLPVLLLAVALVWIAVAVWSDPGEPMRNDAGSGD